MRGLASTLQLACRALMALLAGAVLFAALPCAAAAPGAHPVAMAAHQHQGPRMADAPCVVACPLQAILSHPADTPPVLSTLPVEFEEAAAPWRGQASQPRAPPPR